MAKRTYINSDELGDVLATEGMASGLLGNQCGLYDPFQEDIYEQQQLEASLHDGAEFPEGVIG